MVGIGEGFLPRTFEGGTPTRVQNWWWMLSGSSIWGRRGVVSSAIVEGEVVFDDEEWNDSNKDGRSAA